MRVTLWGWLPLLFLSATEAHGQGRWQVVYRASDQVVSIDTKTVTVPASGIVRVWMRAEFASPQQTQTGTKYSSAVSQDDYDCVKRRWRLLTLTLYDAYGESVYSRGAADTAWSLVIPDSNGEAHLEGVCRHIKREQYSRRYSPDNPFRPPVHDSMMMHYDTMPR